MHGSTIIIHQEPRNQVPVEGSRSEEGFAYESRIKVEKDIIHHSIVNLFIQS